MKITDKLNEVEEGVSFEFFPPQTEKGKILLKETIDILKHYDPLYLSMTYGAGGRTQARTKAAVELLMERKELIVMPHLTCIGAAKDNIRELLAGYKAQGIENIMALRGDPPQDTVDFEIKNSDFKFAADLVSVIKAQGNFCIGVAVYPEGHIETASLAEDLEYAKIKIDAGADFAVTQMFFDNRYFYELIERMQKKGLNLPVLPGILPLTDVAKVKQFAALCRTTIPRDIESAMERFRDNLEDMEKLGIEYTINQCLELKKKGFKKIHFFTLNKPNVITRILEGIK
ncbi:MAG: methylenetetrahydrofolate reductase [NAD(P)H] [Candidatus Omnitrophota bacterium]